MRGFLLTIIFVFALRFAHGQECYAGLTGDFNSGIGERYTYGLGVHVEARVWNCENLYFNWHYTFGSNSHEEMYLHGGMSLLIYRNPAWWLGARGDGRAFLITLLGPLVVPNGMTYYLPRSSSNWMNKRLRVGVYCNPLAMDYWDAKPYKVTSWTVEYGTKLLWETNSGRILYLAGGLSLTNNMRRQQAYNGYGTEELVHIQVGILSLQ